MLIRPHVLLAIVALAAAFRSPESAGAEPTRCAWKAADGDLVDAVVRTMIARPGEEVAWSLSVRGSTARFEATRDGVSGLAEISLDSRCREDWSVSGSLFEEDTPSPEGPAWLTLAALPLAIMRASAPQALPPPALPRGDEAPAPTLRFQPIGDAFDPWHGGAQAVVLALVILALGLSLRRDPWAANAGAPERILLPLLSVVAALPLLSEPFLDDGPVQRLAMALFDPGGDWHHPVFSILLLSPGASLSLEPWVLRLGPLAAVIAETFLVVTTAARAGRRPAGMLAGLWCVCGVRAYPGIRDLSGWGLAGILFLLWLDLVPRDRPAGTTEDSTSGTPKIAGGVLLVAAGLLTSIALYVPAFLLVGERLLAWRRAGKPTRVAPWIPPTVLILTLALGAWKIVESLSSHWSGGAGGLPDLVAGLVAMSPMGRTLAMVLPVGVGCSWMILSIRRPLPRFLLLTLTATVALVLLLSPFTAIKNYHAHLAVLVACWAAGVGVSLLAFRFLDRGSGRTRVAVRIAVWGALAALVASTVSFPTRLVPAQRTTFDLDAEVARLAIEEDAPILTDGPGFDRGLVYELCRRGQLPREALDPYRETPAPGSPRILRTPLVDSSEDDVPRGRAGTFYVMAMPRHFAAQEHVAGWKGCSPLFSEVHPGRYFRCTQ